MKYISKIFTAIVCLAAFLTACDKKSDLALYPNGTAPTLSASTNTFAPTATDSNKVAVTFLWSDPKYATDSATEKYIIQIDSSGRNFSKAVSKTVSGKLSTSYTNKEFNDILLGFGFAFNVAYDVDVRVTSSYGNNNEQYKSNTIKLRATPYKIPPKIALPTGGKLWANGGALPWNWTGNPPTPQSELSRIDNEKWGGVFNLASDNKFLILSQNGGTNPYDQKYAVPSNAVSTITTGGSFGFYPPGSGGDDFKSPVAAGWYKMILDFQTGLFTISSFGADALPQALYILGDGTAGGWNNAPPAAQKFTRLNSSEYEITVPFVPGGYYKFISSYGNWQPQFGGKSVTGGVLGANYGSGSDPDAVPTPAVAGNYKINVNFLLNTYSVTKL